MKRYDRRHHHEHEAINAREFPGTRQLCSLCEQPTGRCEEDSIYADYDEDHELGPICEECRDSFRMNDPA